MEAADYQTIATIASLAIGTIGAVASLYLKNSNGKYAGLLGESVALMQDVSLTLANIQTAAADKVITEAEVEQIAGMVEDMKGHVLKIQNEVGLKAA